MPQINQNHFILFHFLQFQALSSGFDIQALRWLQLFKHLSLSLRACVRACVRVCVCAVIGFRSLLHKIKAGLKITFSKGVKERPEALGL